MLLVKSGVPWDVAFSLEDHEATALCIIFGQLDGGKFDFDRMAWRKD
jgi:hypothetical protein